MPLRPARFLRRDANDIAGQADIGAVKDFAAFAGRAQKAAQDARDARSRAELEALRLAWLSRGGLLTRRLRALSALSPAARKGEGKRLNELRLALEEAISFARLRLEEKALARSLASEAVDVTLPGRPQAATAGALHPVTVVLERMMDIFAAMGFTVAEGPDIEDDFHNFTALNIPPEHPARQMHDTFYLREKGALLRTHTSPVQIRAMRQHPPPLRVIAAGRVYRSDSDQTHTPMFHQLEGLALGRDLHMGHLKGCLATFCRAFFKADVPLRLRPSFFPFTEPSAEVDISCAWRDGALVLGGGEDWLEVLGCGMVHPDVLSACDIDPERWQGFAFGLGVERLAMLAYGIADIRSFFEADPRWLGRYGFSPFAPTARSLGG